MIGALLLAAAATAPGQAIPVLESASAFEANLRELQRDGAPVVLHFFSTWCGPCRTEMPRLRGAFKEAHRRGARVALISLDERRALKKQLPAFLRRTGVDAPVWLLTGTEPEAIAALLDPSWTGGLPATFVVHGQRVTSFLGPIRQASRLLDALAAPPEAGSSGPDGG